MNIHRMKDPWRVLNGTSLESSIFQRMFPGTLLSWETVKVKLLDEIHLGNAPYVLLSDSQCIAVH